MYEHQQSVLACVHHCLFVYFFLLFSLSPVTASNSGIAAARLTPQLSGWRKLSLWSKTDADGWGEEELKRARFRSSVPVSSNVSKEHENHLFSSVNQTQSFSHHRFDWHFKPIKVIITTQSTDVPHHPDQTKGQSRPSCSIISLFTKLILRTFILKRTSLQSSIET